MSINLSKAQELEDLESYYNIFREITRKLWMLRSKPIFNINSFQSYPEALDILMEAVKSLTEELLNHKGCCSTSSSNSDFSKFSGDDIEKLLRKGLIEDGYLQWKEKNFEFLINLSAGTNFYYLRQIMLYRESNSFSNHEKNSDIQQMILDYEHLQYEYNQLLNKNNSTEQKKYIVNFI